jgi:hypothetical protein
MFGGLYFPHGEICSKSCKQLSIELGICAPGTHYCWVARGDVDSKLAQGFHVWPVPGIEPVTSHSQARRLNRSATRSTGRWVLGFKPQGGAIEPVPDVCVVHPRIRLYLTQVASLHNSIASKLQDRGLKHYAHSFIPSVILCSVGPVSLRFRRSFPQYIQYHFRSYFSS